MAAAWDGLGETPHFPVLPWYHLGQTGGSLLGQRRWSSTRELSSSSSSRTWNGTGSEALLPLLKACAGI